MLGQSRSSNKISDLSLLASHKTKRLVVMRPSQATCHLPFPVCHTHLLLMIVTFLVKKKTLPLKMVKDKKKQLIKPIPRSLMTNSWETTKKTFLASMRTTKQKKPHTNQMLMSTRSMIQWMEGGPSNIRKVSKHTPVPLLSLQTCTMILM